MLDQKWLYFPQEEAIGCSRVEDQQARFLEINRSHDALVVHHVGNNGILLCQMRHLLLRLRQEILGLAVRHSCAFVLVAKQWTC